MGKVIALASTKGGAGKTTLAKSLAVRAARDGARVAIIDRDPQESLASWHDRRGSPDNPHLLDMDACDEAVGLLLADGFDWIIIDTPPALLDLIEAAIHASDFVIIPCRASMLDLAAIGPVMELCGIHHKPFGFVINAAGPPIVAQRSAREYLEQNGSVFNQVITQRAAFVAAATLGKSASEMGSTGKEAAREIDALWDEITTVVGSK